MRACKAAPGPMHQEEQSMAERRARKAVVALATAAATMTASALAAAAQGDFPARPARLVNPYAPGGTVDLVGRALASGLSEIWGHQVIVDNRPGGGTTIGTEIVARAQPDGYTMLCNSSSIAIMPSMYRSLRFDTVRDLTPVVHIAASEQLLAIHPGLPAKSVKELIALAKSRPGEITAAASGIGSSTHLNMELFKVMAGVDILVVPYKGGGPAIADLLGGQVKTFFNSANAFLPLMKAGRVRVLATTGAKRAEYAPDIPTVAEAGVPGYEASNWFGIYGPKDLPAALARKWNAATNEYLKTPQAQEHFRKSYLRIVGGSVAEFTAHHRSETARWGKIVTATGIQAQ
jgi:tripartite-type tricarboxylate transporter receptor subunit TctC